MSEERKRTQVADVDRSLYDFTKSEEGYERYADGLTPEMCIRDRTLSVDGTSVHLASMTSTSSRKSLAAMRSTAEMCIRDSP